MDAPVSFRLNPKGPAAARYSAGKVAMTTLIEDYIHERLDIEGDFRAFIRERHSVADYKFVADHFKFLLTNFLPEVLIHSQEQDIRIGREHYDRGNDFFGWFLGPRMIYTSGFFTSPNQTLEQAQDQKMKLVCDKKQLKKGERYLDIGCGWGTLVATAAKDYGVDATGITIAQKGAAYGTEQ
ncbi:MAG TPA: class I SAM-dependent methyltransferase, partial [Archangium sp.]